MIKSLIHRGECLEAKVRIQIAKLYFEFSRRGVCESFSRFSNFSFSSKNIIFQIFPFQPSKISDKKKKEDRILPISLAARSREQHRKYHMWSKSEILLTIVQGLYPLYPLRVSAHWSVLVVGGSGPQGFHSQGIHIQRPRLHSAFYYTPVSSVIEKDLFLYFSNLTQICIRYLYVNASHCLSLLSLLIPFPFSRYNFFLFLYYFFFLKNTSSMKVSKNHLQLNIS